MEIYEIDYALSRERIFETIFGDLRTWGNFSKDLFFNMSDLHASRSKINVSSNPPGICVVIDTSIPGRNFKLIPLFSAEIRLRQKVNGDFCPILYLHRRLSNKKKYSLRRF